MRSSWFADAITTAMCASAGIVPLGSSTSSVE
jgi:hypothetical protein